MENKEIRKKFKKRNDIILESRIEREIKNSLEKKGFGPNADIPSDISEEVHLNQTSRVVKQYLNFLDNQTKYISNKYKIELQHKRGDDYPFGWIVSDPIINKGLDSHESTLPLIKYLFNLNRNEIHQKDLDYMENLIEKSFGKKMVYKSKNGQKYPYSSFIVDDDFYNKTSKEITKVIIGKCSSDYVKKYIGCFNKIGIIEMMGKIGRDETVYVDGYYTINNKGRWVKHPLLKKDNMKDRKFKVGLRNLPTCLRPQKE